MRVFTALRARNWSGKGVSSTPGGSEIAHLATEKATPETNIEEKGSFDSRSRLRIIHGIRIQRIVNGAAISANPTESDLTVDCILHRSANLAINDIIYTCQSRNGG